MLRGQLLRCLAAVHEVRRTRYERRLGDVAGPDHLLNTVPNIGRPLFESCLLTSSSITSQCSSKTSFAIRTMSAAIQLAGWPKPEKRPSTITKSPSATMVPGSYFNLGGRLLIRLDRLS